MAFILGSGAGWRMNGFFEKESVASSSRYITPRLRLRVKRFFRLPSFSNASKTITATKNSTTIDTTIKSLCCLSSTNRRCLIQLIILRPPFFLFRVEAFKLSQYLLASSFLNCGSALVGLAGKPDPLAAGGFCIVEEASDSESR